MDKSEPARERSVEELLAGSKADIAAGRVRDLDALLIEMGAKVRRRSAEIETENAKAIVAVRPVP